MQATEKRSAKALPADIIQGIVAKHLRRDPAQCLHHSPASCRAFLLPTAAAGAKSQVRQPRGML